MNRVVRLPETSVPAANSLGDLEAFMRSLRALMNAPNKADAIAVAVSLCAVHVNAPTAAWIWEPGQDIALLAAWAGLSPRLAVLLEDEMKSIECVKYSGLRRLELVDRFAEVAEASNVFVIEVDEVLILVAASPPHPDFPHEMRSFLASVLELREQKDLSEERDRRLGMGLALTAHELRAPLLAAKAAIEASQLHRGEDGPSLEAPSDVRLALLSRAQHQLELLAETCESLLMWAADECSLELTPIRIVEPVRAALDECSLHPGKCAVGFVSLDDGLMIEGSPLHLKIAVSNLVRNALNYSPATEPVLVLLEPSRDKAVVSVKDRGPGLPPDQLRRVFDPFVRGINDKSSRSGAGLGLFIAKKIVEGHRGQIWAEPSSDGTTFVIEIPTIDIRGRRP